MKFPGKKKRLCASAQDAHKGEKQFVTIATANTGKHGGVVRRGQEGRELDVRRHRRLSRR